MNQEEYKLLGLRINKAKFSTFIKISALIGLLLLIFVSILILNHSVLLSPDDYNYTFVPATGNSRRVDSLENALMSAKFFYNNWTGRVIPHVLIGVFRSLDPNVYTVVNSLMFMFLITLVGKVLNKKTSFFAILSVFGYLTFSMMFGEKFAWISGAFNYLWPATMMTILVYYFYKYYTGEKELNILGKIALILFAFIAAFMHENTAFVGGSFLLCMFIFKFKDYLNFEKSKKITLAIIFVMFCLGAAATIFAPGNLVRMEGEGGNFSWAFLDNYKNNQKVLKAVLLSMVAVFVLENIKVLKDDENVNISFKRNFKKLNYSLVKEEFLHFILPALIATVPMAVIAYFPPRAFLAYEVMFMIVFAKNVCYVIEYFSNYEKLIAACSIVATLFVFAQFSPSTLAQINYIIPYKQKVTAQYEEAQKRGEKDVIVSLFEYSPWIHIYDWINISNFYPEFNFKMPVNRLISTYYGFDRLTALSENEYIIELTVDTEGINPYSVYDVEAEQFTLTFEYDNLIRFSIPKDKFKVWKLDCRENDIENLVLDYKVRFVGGDLSKDEYSLDDLLLTK